MHPYDRLERRVDEQRKELADEIEKVRVEFRDEIRALRMLLLGFALSVAAGSLAIALTVLLSLHKL